MKSLAAFIDTLSVEPSHPWAWANYRPMIESALTYFGGHSILEMGGGRMPLFKPNEIEERNLNYVINDIDQSELDLLEPGYQDTASVMCADITKFPQDQTFDLIISKMVYEHVKDNNTNLSNQLKMLNPGGVVVHFHPVLYSVPLIVNRILPVSSSRKLMDLIYGKSLLKFPAYYDKCRATRAAEQNIRNLGYSEVQFIPIWGHNYYRNIPVLHSLQAAIGRQLAARDIRLLSTFCFTIARK